MVIIMHGNHDVTNAPLTIAKSLMEKEEETMGQLLENLLTHIPKTVGLKI